MTALEGCSIADTDAALHRLIDEAAAQRIESGDPPLQLRM